MLRALVVEDNLTFLEAFKTALHEGFPFVVIEVAGSGEEALLKINGTPPDFVFTDMRLPGMNGLELAQKLKNHFPVIRIAMVTNYDLPEYREAASQHGIERFFAKESLDWKEIKEFVQSTPKNKQ
ncbi:MAG: response regulator transcription factor [Deltaproteobacteria bacterium]